MFKETLFSSRKLIMKKEFQSFNNNTSDNIFDGVYEIRASKVIGIIISVVNISIITPGANFINIYKQLLE
jgi:hypothetical protein